MSSIEYTYDVFVSYRHQEPDRDWIRNTLVPRLKDGGFQACMDYECFRLGAPLVLEMTRAVEQSRYTFAVLSPAYLTSNFAELENVMAEHLGVEREPAPAVSGYARTVQAAPGYACPSLAGYDRRP